MLGKSLPKPQPLWHSYYITIGITQGSFLFKKNPKACYEGKWKNKNSNHPLPFFFFFLCRKTTINKEKKETTAAADGRTEGNDKKIAKYRFMEGKGKEKNRVLLGGGAQANSDQIKPARKNRIFEKKLYVLSDSERTQPG